MSPVAEVKMMVTFFAGFFALLTVLSVFTIITRNTAMGLFSVVLRGAHRVGLYRPESNNRTAEATRPDRGFLWFSRALRVVSRFTPGDPNRHPHTVIVPMFFLGIPAFVGLFAVFWAVPLYLFMAIVGGMSGSWATLVAVLSVVGYLAAVVTGAKLLVRMPAMMNRQTNSLSL